MSVMRGQAEAARAAWRELSVAPEGAVRRALLRIADRIDDSRGHILSENAQDVADAGRRGLPAPFIERLTLSGPRIDSIVGAIREVAGLGSPVGEIIESSIRPSGLRIVKRRVPIGVIGVIYESRPNVTADVAALCLKSGNAAILRGGSDALRSNAAIVDAIRGALAETSLPPDSVQMAADPSREATRELMTMNGLIDLLIPRGGRELIDSVVRTATVPVIQTGIGICHVYVDGACDFGMARSIAVSAKVSRPSVCNAEETLLVDRAIAAAFLPDCLAELRGRGVEIRGCEETRRIDPEAAAATEEGYRTEYNALILNVKIVGGVDGAIEHIERYGSRHSEAIVTGDPAVGERFLSRVDAAAVYVNASTRFTDGGEFGLGAEIGISNQKLHARGPMGLRELTTHKYEVTGSGQIR